MDTPRCRRARGGIASAILAVCLGFHAAAQTPGARLANISTRGQVGAEADNLFGGFVISGGSKTVLVRAIGPSLAAFGVGGTLADPVLKLFDAGNAGGTDHGWGNHQLIMGGAVQGGDIYGTMPSLTVGANDDTGRGRWIPSTSVDEYSATLASWFGVAQGNLPVVLPNIGRFARPNLGFL